MRLLGPQAWSFPFSSLLRPCKASLGQLYEHTCAFWGLRAGLFHFLPFCGPVRRLWDSCTTPWQTKCLPGVAFPCVGASACAANQPADPLCGDVPAWPKGKKQVASAVLGKTGFVHSHLLKCFVGSFSVFDTFVMCFFCILILYFGLVAVCFGLRPNCSLHGPWKRLGCNNRLVTSCEHCCDRLASRRQVQ